MVSILNIFFDINNKLFVRTPCQFLGLIDTFYCSLQSCRGKNIAIKYCMHLVQTHKYTFITSFNQKTHERTGLLGHDTHS